MRRADARQGVPALRGRQHPHELFRGQGANRPHRCRARGDGPAARPTGERADPQLPRGHRRDVCDLARRGCLCARQFRFSRRAAVLPAQPHRAVRVYHRQLVCSGAVGDCRRNLKPATCRHHSLSPPTAPSRARAPDFAPRFALSDFAALRGHSGPVPHVPRGPLDIANIVYPSGTTGPSKGVLQPFRWMNHYTYPLRATTTSADVLYCDLPLYHVSGAFSLLSRALWRGTPGGLWDRFSPTRFWERIEDCGASSCILLDVMIPWLMNAAPRPGDRAHTLNKVHMQPLPVNHNEVARRFGIDFVSCGFGQTESGSGFACLIDELGDQTGTPPALWKGRSKAEYRASCQASGRLLVDGNQPLPKGFMGRANPVLDVAILDEDDTHVPPGAAGQLAFRPRFPVLLLQEYLRKPQVTVKAQRNCWFHTGDACRQIAEAPDTYAFVDRMGGLCRVRGENVSSFDVEALLARQPGVRAVAAVPIPAQVGDEDEIAVFIEVGGG